MDEMTCPDSGLIRGVAMDARLTLMDCAQAFHWVCRADGFYGVCAGHTAWVRPCDDGCFEIVCQAGYEAFWTHYFDIGRDDDALLSACRNYPAALKALKLLPGLRVLNQPVWETLVTFIISANNNAGRIRRLVESLCAAYGTHYPDVSLYGFPEATAIANAGAQALRGLGFGYRAEYLVETARRVADGFPLETLRDMPYEQAHEHLTELAGVGDKVADCVLLFGCEHAEAFPVDVWVKRLMRAWFLPGVDSKRAMGEAARAMFGPQAGRIQQALFHCARMGILDVNKNENE